jgi:chemotaxis protein MotB
MKYLNSALFILALTFMFYSCSPIYKCGEPKPTKKLFLPKIILNVINERDSLCTLLSARDNEVYSLKKDTSSLNSKINNLKKDTVSLNNRIDNLEKKYNSLANDKLSQSAQYNIALKKKSDELIAKEKLLVDRENSLNDLKKVVTQQDSITNRLKKILHNALFDFKSDELSVEIKNGKVYVSMSDKLLFKSGSAAIEAKGIEAIKVLAAVLNKNNDIDILVEGYTDNIPIRTVQYHDNWDLSAERAISIVRILTDEYQIAPTRLTASGKGEFLPRATNSTPEGRAKNRRTEIILSPKLDELMKLLKAN